MAMTQDSFSNSGAVVAPVPPMICIPATGGTASNISRFLNISDRQQRRRMAIGLRDSLPALRRRAGISGDLASAGVVAADIPVLVENAQLVPSIATSLHLPNCRDIETLYVQTL